MVTQTNLRSLLLLGLLSACGVDGGSSRTLAIGESVDYTAEPTVTRLARIGTQEKHDVSDVYLVAEDRVLVTGRWGSRIVTLDGDVIGPLEGELGTPYLVRGLVGRLVNGNLLVIWTDIGPNNPPDRVQVHDPNGALVAKLPGPFLWERLSSRVTLDGRQILLWEDGADAYVRVIDAETLGETRLLTVDHEWIDDAMILTGGELVVFDHDDELRERAQIYDETGAVTAVIGGVGRLRNAQPLPNGTFLVETSAAPAASTDTIAVYDRAGTLLWSYGVAPSWIDEVEVDGESIFVTHSIFATPDARVFDVDGTLLRHYADLPSTAALVRLPTGQLLSIQNGFVADVDSHTPISWPAGRLSAVLVVPETGALVGWRNFDVRAVFRLDF
jgi:hypothetical protein